jgi:hypothetical protein
MTRDLAQSVHTARRATQNRRSTGPSRGRLCLAKTPSADASRHSKRRSGDKKCHLLAASTSGAFSRPAISDQNGGWDFGEAHHLNMGRRFDWTNVLVPQRPPVSVHVRSVCAASPVAWPTFCPTRSPLESLLQLSLSLAVASRSWGGQYSANVMLVSAALRNPERVPTQIQAPLSQTLEPSTCLYGGL